MKSEKSFKGRMSISAPYTTYRYFQENLPIMHCRRGFRTSWNDLCRTSSTNQKNNWSCQCQAFLEVWLLVTGESQPKVFK